METGLHRAYVNERIHRKKTAFNVKNPSRSEIIINRDYIFEDEANQPVVTFSALLNNSKQQKRSARYRGVSSMMLRNNKNYDKRW